MRISVGPNTVPQFDYQFVADASGVMDIHLFANGYRYRPCSEPKDFLSRSAAAAAELRRPAPRYAATRDFLLVYAGHDADRRHPGDD